MSSWEKTSVSATGPSVTWTLLPTWVSFSTRPVAKDVAAMTLPTASWLAPGALPSTVQTSPVLSAPRMAFAPPPIITTSLWYTAPGMAVTDGP